MFVAESPVFVSTESAVVSLFVNGGYREQIHTAKSTAASYVESDLAYATLDHSSPKWLRVQSAAATMVADAPVEDRIVSVRASMVVNSTDGLKLDVQDAFKEIEKQVFFWG